MEDINKITSDVAGLAKDFGERGERAYQITREVLAFDNKYDLPKEIVKVDVIPAFRSRKEFNTDFTINSLSANASYLGLLVGQKIVIPDSSKKNLY